MSVGNVIVGAAGESTDTALGSVSHTLATEMENLTLAGSAVINGTSVAVASINLTDLIL